MKTIAIKNNICIKNTPTDCGTKMLENFVAPYNATVVDKLTAAGLNVTRDSSELALSSCCNLMSESGSQQQNIMLKPTRGAVSRYGLITACPSLEEITIIGQTVDDVAELFNIVRGIDEKDSTTVDGVAIGIPQEIRKGELPNIDYAKITHDIIAAAETFSSLARFDGIKFGHRSENAATLADLYENTRAEGFDYNTKLQIMLGGVALSRENRRLYYDRAIRARAKITEEINTIFENCDIIVTPIDENSAVIPSLIGLPSLVLPKSIQIIGPKFSEELLLHAAKEVLCNV